LIRKVQLEDLGSNLFLDGTKICPRCMTQWYRQDCSVLEAVPRICCTRPRIGQEDAHVYIIKLGARLG